jgi:multidrug resistance efflux pump
MTDDIDIRSEEVQELLGTPPHWLVRWGLLFALVLLIVTVWLLYWITFPETVNAVIRIKREDPEVELITPRSGHISHILVESEDTVVAGQTLIVLKSPAEFADIHYLDDKLGRVNVDQDSVLVLLNLPTDLILGRVKEQLYAFQGKQEEVRNLQEGRLSQMSIDDIQREIRQEEREISQERLRKELLANELITLDAAYNRELNLFKSGRIGDYNRVREKEASKLQYERYVLEAESSIKARESNINLLRRQLATTATISEASKQKAMDDLRTEFENLRAAVDDWRRRNLVVSSIDGVVILDDVQETNYVESEDRLAVVIPASPSSLIGKTELKLNESGQVAVGQKVIVDFYSFPAQQYGAVEGIITVKSKIPTKDDTLPIEIRFPNGLVTNTGRSLEVGQDMAGDMTIIIEEKRLISWLLQRI